MKTHSFPDSGGIDKKVNVLWRAFSVPCVWNLTLARDEEMGFILARIRS
jgi:hypothetical protein